MFNFNVQEIDVSSLHEMLTQEGDGVKIIDVRMHGEVARGAIPGAEHIPLNTLSAQRDRIPEDKKVIFYCRSGARSAQACAYFGSLGLDNVYNLRGGIMAWVQEGKDVA